MIGGQILEVTGAKWAHREPFAEAIQVAPSKQDTWAYRLQHAWQGLPNTEQRTKGFAQVRRVTAAETFLGGDIAT